MTKKLLLGVLSLVLITSFALTACEFIDNKLTSKIATVDSMVIVPTTHPLDPFGADSDALCVYLKPVNAKAEVVYKADLYEKDNLRDTVYISWNQPEINVATSKSKCFRISQEEMLAYRKASLEDSGWWKSIFSVEVHE